MGKCRKGIYTSNDVVMVTRPLVCYGFKAIKEPECTFLPECFKDYGLEIHVTKTGRKRIRKIKL